MNSNARDRGKNRSRSGTNLLPFLRKKSEDDKGEMVTVREEKKTLLRVIKAKPKAVAHRSEVLKSKVLTEEEMRITEEVVKNISSSPDRLARSGKRVSGGQASPKYFVCVECGSRVPEGSEVCPKCRARYILDLSPESVAELERVQASVEYDEDPLEQQLLESLPVLHFDALDGIMSYLEPDSGESDFVLECSQCGTLVALDITHCPMCGAELGVSDIGILSLLKDTEFDTEAISELECPLCGEHVVLQEGTCPQCQAVIVDSVATVEQNKMIPLINTENVVFVHVDLETGDLNYIQRHLRRLALEHTSIQLEGIGNGGFDHDWEGLSRI